MDREINKNQVRQSESESVRDTKIMYVNKYVI